MRKRALTLTLALTLLFSAVVGVLTENLVEANPVPPTPSISQIIIKSDGNIEPSNAPITRAGNVYTFSSSIHNSFIEVQCDDIVIDANSFTLQGVDHPDFLGPYYKGIVLEKTRNVVIQEIIIRDFAIGISLNGSHCTVSNNTIIDCECGVKSWGDYNTISYNNLENDLQGISLTTSFNTITENSLSDYMYGIYLTNADSNTISHNIVKNGKGGIVFYMSEHNDYNRVFNNRVEENTQWGILLHTASHNKFYDNYVANNIGPPKNDLRGGIQQGWGISLSGNDYIAEDNTFYRNVFSGNIYDVQILSQDFYNAWDNGFEGNYWSDYNGTDSNSDGVGDTPFIINGNNQDNYPLMKPNGVRINAVGDMLVIVVGGVFAVAFAVGVLIYLRKRRQ